MIIVETSVFTRRIKELMEDEAYAKFQQLLIHQPDIGDLIPHSGGLRKVRWKQKGKGKRGGIRVIYYWAENDQIWMLYVYAKTRQENLTNDQLHTLKKIVSRWKL